eukprot:765084-Amphidinium_carterae.1
MGPPAPSSLQARLTAAVLQAGLKPGILCVSVYLTVQASLVAKRTQLIGCFSRLAQSANAAVCAGGGLQHRLPHANADAVARASQRRSVLAAVSHRAIWQEDRLFCRLAFHLGQVWRGNPSTTLHHSKSSLKHLMHKRAPPLVQRGPSS